MKAPLEFTEHALDRFIERHFEAFQDKPTRIADLKAHYRENARGVLEYIRAHAVFVEDLPDEGQEIWHGPSEFSYVLLVVRDGLVTTVLPAGATRPEGRSR